MKQINKAAKLINNVRTEQWMTIFAHLSGWLLLFAFFTCHDDSSFLTASILLVYGAFLFYLNYFLLTPRYLLRNRYVPFGVLTLSSVLLLTLTINRLPHNLFDKSFIFQETAVFPLLSIAILSVSSSIPIFRQLKHEKNVNQHFFDKKQDDELILLRQQVNPHFLFNALNNIHSLAYRKSEQTSEAIAKLSAILRYTLSENPRQEIPVTREIAWIENYIALQKLWTKNSVTVDFEVKNMNESFSIEPFILNPLVENAFKYGTCQGIESIISIHLCMEADWLNVQISNPVFPGKAETKESLKIGLNNVTRRLELCYPGTHRFESARKGELYEINLSMKLRKDELHCN